ncbi:MAG: hypothetical protein AAF198_10360 [Pseudomonadota bacterium]
MSSPIVVLHPGFHKSGTSSLQHFLDTNKESLHDYTNVLSWGDFPDITKVMRPVSKFNLSILDSAYRRAFRKALAQVDPSKHLVLSREILLGMIPGNKTILGRPITSYSRTSRRLLTICLDEIQRLYGSNVTIIVLLTVRNHESWLWSVYRHLVKVNLRTGSFSRFKNEMKHFQGVHGEADKLIAAFPDIQVLKSRLEDVASKPFGHAQIVLDLLDIPQSVRATLQGAERKHIGIPENRIEELIQINRYSFYKGRARKRKEKLLSHD